MNNEIDTVVTSQIDAGIDGIDTVATVYGEDYGLDPTVELFIYPVYADADPVRWPASQSRILNRRWRWQLPSWRPRRSSGLRM